MNPPETQIAKAKHLEEHSQKVANSLDMSKPTMTPFNIPPQQPIIIRLEEPWCNINSVQLKQAIHITLPQRCCKSTMAYVNLCKHQSTNTTIRKKDPNANKLYIFVFKLSYTTCFFAALLLFTYLAHSR